MILYSLVVVVVNAIANDVELSTWIESGGTADYRMIDETETTRKTENDSVGWWRTKKNGRSESSTHNNKKNSEWKKA